MTEAKHTPAPWRTQFVGGHEVDLITKGGTFAGINAGSGAPDALDADDYAEWLANVNLMVAAPYMLEALLNARSQLSALGGTAGVHMGDEDAHATGCDMVQRAVIMNIDGAIAKATGAA